MLADSEQLQAELTLRGLALGDGVCVSQVIQAASDSVWQAISQPGHFKQCHPFCRETVVLQWPGVGAKDTLTYYSGVHYQRDFVTWIEGVGYDIEVGPPPDKTARVLWRIKALSEQRSELMIGVLPYLKSDLPESRKQSYQRRFLATRLPSILRASSKASTTSLPLAKRCERISSADTRFTPIEQVE